jgi:CO/xanthine dehydrogenase FAD-binding subunit
MKAPPFEYFAPDSLDEVLGLLHEHGDEAKLLAGGQSLVPLFALRLARASVLVDLRRVPGLSAIELVDSSLLLGAMVREATVERSASVCDAVPLLAEAVPLIGHPAIRNWGTVGGSLAHADPAAEIPAVALALDAELLVRSTKSERSIPASDFWRGFWTTALQPDEALIGVRFPVAAQTSGVCFEEVARRHGDFAIVGAAASLRLEGDRVAECRLALVGVADTPLRPHEVERGIEGTVPTADAIADAAAEAALGLEPASDLHGTAAFRRHLARVVSARALRRAAERAGATT